MIQYLIEEREIRSFIESIVDQEKLAPNVRDRLIANLINDLATNTEVMIAENLTHEEAKALGALIKETPAAMDIQRFLVEHIPNIADLASKMLVEFRDYYVAKS